MDIWKQIAMNDLQRYSHLECSIRSLQEKIAAMARQMASCGGGMGNTVVGGTKLPLEDKYVNSLALKGKYENQLKANTLDYRAIRRAVESLSDKDQRVLQLAYINRGKFHIEKIMEEFCVERSQAYRDKDAALANYIIAMYGR